MFKGVVEKLHTLRKQCQTVEVNATDTSTNMVSGDLISASNFIQNSEMFVSEQLITPQLESLIVPAGMNYDVPEPATQSSWVASEGKVSFL